MTLAVVRSSAYSQVEDQYVDTQRVWGRIAPSTLEYRAMRKKCTEIRKFLEKRNISLIALLAMATTMQACGGGSQIDNSFSSGAIINETASKRKNTLKKNPTDSSTTVIDGTTTLVNVTNSSVVPITATASPANSTANGTATTNTTVTIEGMARSAVDLDVITTRSGDWLLQNLGSYKDAQIYLMKLSGNPDFVRVFACRRAFARETNDGVALSVLSVPVAIQHGSSNYSWLLGIAQGACRVMQNMEPVRPNIAWLREAVQQKRIPSYSRSRAWAPLLLTPLGYESTRANYDPNSLGPIPGDSARTPTSSNNYVGVTNPMGGEYSASRGFIHDIDAKVIDAALNNSDSAIGAAWSQIAQYTWYSLAQPQGAVWSPMLHTTVDPQIPQSGEVAWETPIWSPSRTDILSLTEVTDWTRDVAHLENTGFVHWILTEDPVAGLVVQRQAAYALASFYEILRPSSSSEYRAYTGQERGNYNYLSALWKSLDVSKRVSSLRGTMIWDAARTSKQAADVISDLENIYQKMVTATAGTSDDYARKIASAGLANTFEELMDTPSGRVNMTMVSNFMLPQYGKEPLYLWSSAGNIIVKRWLTAAADHAVARLTLIGGTAGVDGCVGTRGSSFPLKFAGTNPGFDNAQGWATWVKSICPAPSHDTFDNVIIHTATQFEGLLLMARDAGVSELDVPISKIQMMKERTSSLKWVNLQMHKHLAGPIQ